jgi:polyisoprenoid-binding protein YceI
MRTPIRTLALFACLAPATLALRAASTAMTVEPGSRIWVAGTSTVRSFTCEAPQFETAIEAAAPGAVGSLLAGERAVQSATLRIAAARMDCGNGTMNGHMQRALKSADNPTITFVLSAYEPTRTAAGIAGTISGQLTLGGVTKPVTMPASARRDGDALRVTGAHDLNMTEYGLKPPTLMMGTMKVGRVVKVNFDLLIKG